MYLSSMWKTEILQMCSVDSFSPWLYLSQNQCYICLDQLVEKQAIDSCNHACLWHISWSAIAVTPSQLPPPINSHLSLIWICDKGTRTLGHVRHAAEVRWWCEGLYKDLSIALNRPPGLVPKVSTRTYWSPSVVHKSSVIVMMLATL